METDGLACVIGYATVPACHQPRLRKGRDVKTRDDLLTEIRQDQAAWHDLLVEVGEERMEEPGPMGDWTFKDLAAHLMVWRERGIERLSGGPGATPPPPWPASMGTEDEIEDWDEVNTWFYEQHRDWPLRDVLAGVDRSYDRLADLIATMPEEDLMTPGRFEGINGALVDAELLGHLHEEHMPSIRAWLEARNG